MAASWKAGIVPAIVGLTWSAGGSPVAGATSALHRLGYPNLSVVHCEKTGPHDWSCLVASDKTGLLAGIRFRIHLVGGVRTYEVAERRVGNLASP